MMFRIEHRKPNGGWAPCAESVDGPLAREYLEQWHAAGYEVRWHYDGKELRLPWTS